MKRGQLLVLVLAAAAVAIVAVLAGGSDGGDSGGGGSAGAPAKAPANAIKVTFAYSPEKEKLLLPLIDDFNAKRVEVSGKPVFVEGANVSSGEAETKIAAGRYKPVAWSPASSLWGRLLNFEADQQLAPDDAPSIVRTPLVIAMWEPMAKALGYPRKKIGFADILELALDPQGWGSVGRPEFGRFKLVHTNPDYSTSGLSAVVAEYYATTGKKEGLTEADVKSPKVRAAVKAIEQSIVHYGDTTLFIADQMRAEGKTYASAVAMEEVTLLDFNRDRDGQDKLIAIYPKEGTFYSDSPYFVLAGPWVTPDLAAGARAFGDFLLSTIRAPLAAQSGFRPADLKERPAPPITAANGVDPKQPERVLGLPEPRVLAAAKQAWREDRKPANVLLVLDVSGSMNDEDRLERAKDGIDVFLKQVGNQDRVGLTIFNDRIDPVLSIAPLAQVRGRIRSAVRDLVADGGTAFYDAAAEAFASVREMDDRDRINAVVLLTDGEDTDSQNSVDDVLEKLRAQGDSDNRVRVFTIAYSSGATGAKEQLEKIAAATGGKAYEGGTEDIEAVYRSISSFF